MSQSQIFNVINMSFDAFRENKILAKISEFTVNSGRIRVNTDSDNPI